MSGATDPVHAQGEWVELNIEGRKYTVWAIRPVEEDGTYSDVAFATLLGKVIEDRIYSDIKTYYSYRAITAWLDAMPKPINPPRTEAQHK